MIPAVEIGSWVGDMVMFAATFICLVVVVVYGVRYKHEWILLVAIGLAWQVVFYLLLLFGRGFEFYQSVTFRTALFRPAQLVLLAGLVAHLMRDQIRNGMRRLNGKNGVPGSGSS